MIHWEAHACLPLHPQADFAPIDRLRAAGVHYVSINIGMDMNPLPQVMATIAGFRATVAAHPDKYRMVATIDDIEKAKAAGQIGVGFDLEGAMPLLEQPEMVALYKSLGVHQMHLAYNRDNSVAGGCHDTDHGLSPLGHKIVAAINAAGVLMDCSHTGRKTSLDIMAASSAPVIFSHANPQSLVDHGRNITDEQIKASAATGGVVCVNGISFFLGKNNPTADDVAHHAAYVADLVGVEHVGIGLDISFSQDHVDDTPPGDYDPTYWWPKSAGYDRANNPTTYPPVEAWSEMSGALQRTGMTADEAALVMGGNMMRVAQRVWR